MVSSSSSNVFTKETWEPLMGPKVTRGERQQLTQILRAYRSCFAFSMKELGALIGLGIRIELATDTPIFHRPYKYNDMKKDLIRSQTLDLLEVGLVELSHGEHGLAIVMPIKKDVHGNYTDRWMCGDYRSINKQTKSDKYAMHTLRRSLMLWDIRRFSIHLIFGKGAISSRFERRTRPRLHFGASSLTARIVCISGSSYPLG
jgi:hypothetical protein